MKFFLCCFLLLSSCTPSYNRGDIVYLPDGDKAVIIEKIDNMYSLRSLIVRPSDDTIWRSRYYLLPVSQLKAFK